MLQKLLIALCTIFVLSACGGDLDLGPENPPPQDGSGNGDGDGDGDGDGNGEPVESQIWVYEQFEEEDSVDSWATRCIDGCNATAELNRNAGEEVLAVDPEWASDGDDLEVYTSIEEIEDMNGGNATVWVYVTDDYAAKGNLELQLVVTNAAGLSAHTNARSVTNSGWHKVDAWEMQAGTAEEFEEEEEGEGINYGTFAWHDDNFLLNDVNQIGVLFSANGKPAEVGGQLWIDNLLLTPGSAFAPTLLDVTEGWFSKGAHDVDGDVAADPEYGDGFVSLYVDKPNQQLVYPVEGPGNYVDADVVFTLSLDEEYLENADGFQPFGQVFEDTDEESYQDDTEIGGNWSCWTGHSGVEADVEFDVTCTMTDEELFDVEEGFYALFGVQSQTANAQGTIRIHRVEIKGAQVEGDPNMVEASVTEGWRVSDEALNLQYTEDGVSYSPVAEDDQLMYDIAGPQEFGGAEYVIVYDVDQAFVDSGADVQPIIQTTPNFDIGDFGCYVGNGELVVGENEVTCSINDNFDFGEDTGVQIGFQVKENGAPIEGTVTIKSLVVHY